MATRTPKSVQAIKKGFGVIKREMANLEKNIEITEDESPVSAKVRMLQLGILSKYTPKVVTEMKKQFDYLTIFLEEELIESADCLEMMASCLKSMSILVSSLQGELIGQPCQSNFFSDACPIIYSVGRILYEMMMHASTELIKSSHTGQESDEVHTQFINAFKHLFQWTKAFVTAVDFTNVADDIKIKLCSNCQKQSLDLAGCLCTMCEKTLAVLGQTDKTRCSKKLLLSLLAEPFTVISCVCNTILLPLLPCVKQLYKYPAFFKTMQDFLITVTINIKQTLLDGSEFKSEDRRTLLDHIQIMIEDIKCCLPTINRMGDDCSIEIHLFCSLCLRIADWFRNIKKIEPCLCLESDIKVIVPWASASTLTGCYIRTVDDIGGTLKNDILAQITMKPEQSIVSDIFVVDNMSNKFRLSKKQKKALISFPGDVDDDPEKLVFAVHVKVGEIWKQVKAKYQDGTLSFEESEIDIFVAFSDFPMLIHKIIPEEGYCFQSNVQPGLLAEIPPGAIKEAEYYEFKVAPINRERLENYKEVTRQEDSMKDTEDSADETVKTKTDFSSLVSLSDGLIVHRTSNKPLQKSAKVTFPLEGQKDDSEVFLVRITNENNVEVYYEEELNIVSSLNNACTVELKSFSINHLGRIKRKKKKSKDQIATVTMLVIGKMFVCKINIYYIITKTNIVFRAECIDTRSKQLKRRKSKENLKTTLSEKWLLVPIYSPSHDIMMKENDTLQIEVGGFFYKMQETSKETMAITFLRNTESCRTFPVQFKRPKEHDQQPGTLSFLGQDGKHLHTVYVGKELLPPLKRQIPIHGCTESDDICETDLTATERVIKEKMDKFMEAGGSVISDKSLGVLCSLLSIADTKKLALQLGMSWMDIDKVIEKNGGRNIDRSKSEMLEQWRIQQGKKTDISQQLIQGLRDSHLNLYADIVNEVHLQGGGLQPAEMKMIKEQEEQEQEQEQEQDQDQKRVQEQPTDPNI